MTTLSEEILELRKGLIDFGAKNKLLSYTPSLNGIKVVEEDPREIFNILVLNGNKMEFYPLGESDSNNEVILDNDDSYDENTLPAHYLDNFLNTEYTKKELNSKILNLYNKSNQFQKNYGFSTLYISLGFLSWKPSQEAEPSLAPLILIPIQINRQRKVNRFRVYWTEDDISTNLPIQIKLEREFGVNIPDFEYCLCEKEDNNLVIVTKFLIDSYFEEVKNAIKEQKGWEVIEEINVDFFDFRKIAMYRDLDPIRWGDNNLLASQTLGLLEYDSEIYERISALNIDDVLALKNSYPILDADSSQLAIIEHAKQGGSIIVEGPPGTGKSQTIANIIAELLGQNKSILFVSEKMAALEVVKTRLDNVGFGGFCLELHSEKTTLESFYAQIKSSTIYDSLENQVPSSEGDIRSRNTHVEQLQDIRDSLNEYAKAVREPIGDSDKNPLYFIGLKEKAIQKFENANEIFPTIQIKDIGKINGQEWRKAKTVLGAFSTIVDKVPPNDENPWMGTYPLQIFDEELSQLTDHLTKSKELLLEIQTLFTDISLEYGISKNDTLSDINRLHLLINCLSNIPITAEPSVIFSSLESKSNHDEEKNVITEIKKYEVIIEQNSEIVDESIWNLPAEEIVTYYHSLLNDVNEILNQYKLHDKFTDLKDITILFSNLNKLENLRKNLVQKEQEFYNFFRNQWVGEQSNPDNLENTFTLFKELRTSPTIFSNISDTFIKNAIWPDYVLGSNSDSCKAEIVNLADMVKKYQEKILTFQFLDAEKILNSQNLDLNLISDVTQKHDYLISLQENLKIIEGKIDSHCIHPIYDYDSRLTNLNILQERIKLHHDVENQKIEEFIQKITSEQKWVDETFVENINYDNLEADFSKYREIISSYEEISSSLSSLKQEIQTNIIESEVGSTEKFDDDIIRLKKLNLLENKVNKYDLETFAQSFDQNQKRFERLFEEEILELDIKGLLDGYSKCSKNILKIFTYRSLKKEIDSYYKSSASRDDVRRIKDLTFAYKFKNYINNKNTAQKIKIYNDYVELKDLLKERFDQRFLNLNSNYSSIINDYEATKYKLNHIEELLANQGNIIGKYFRDISLSSHNSNILNLIRLKNSVINLSTEETKEKVRTWKRYQELQNLSNNIFHDSVYVIDPSTIQEQYISTFNQYLEIKKNQIEIIERIQSGDKNIISVHYDAYISELKGLQDLIRLHEMITSKEQIGNELLDNIWQKEKTPLNAFEKIESINTWFKEKFQTGIINSSHINLLKNGISITHIFSLHNFIPDANLMDCILTIREINQIKGIIARDYNENIVSSSFYPEQEKINLFVSQISPLFNQYSVIWHCNNYDSFITQLHRVQNLQSIKWAVKELINKTPIYDNIFNGTTPESKTISEYTNWCYNVRNLSSSNEISLRTIECLIDNNSKEGLLKVNTKLIDDLKIFDLIFNQIKELLNINESDTFYQQLHEIDIDDLLSKINGWTDNLSSLISWSDYQRQRKKLKETIAHPILPYIEEKRIHPDLIVPLFEGLYSQMILNRVVRERPPLEDFIVEIHEKTIEQFQYNDEKFFDINKKYLINKIIDSHYFQIKSGGMHDIRIIREQLQKKRNRMSIRQIFLRIGKTISEIFPCVMMSPISVAQFLSNSKKFDVVIFDEASQIRPADAMGAILRGQQLVVIGDTKQLPPTDIFTVTLDEEDENYDEIVGETTTSNKDIESILSLCSVKEIFPKKRLLWHYRSKHESLIAVSNNIFYEGNLVIFPSSDFNSEDKGLFHIINQSFYSPSDCNRLEAKFVANMIVEHFSKYGTTKSLGVATFNAKQQKAIYDELERLRANEVSWIDEYTNSANDLFFIKNLENIQGDERDFIIVSIGFGFQQDKTFSLNFGPVNKTGGERRLNVLFTRAREKCTIVSNFSCDDLDNKIAIAKNSSPGINDLREFLYYAKYREMSEKGSRTPVFESPFEESVYDFLTSKGYDIDTQVGAGNFRIDLAIKDIRPDASTRYLIGIECDGATYHSSMVARDRDRLRQIVLEGDKKQNQGLGWKIHRIWSTDWWRHRERAKEKLIQAIEAQLNLC